MKDTDLVNLFHKIGELKKTKRSGWVRCEIPNPESVADHSFRCAFMAMVLGDILGADVSKLIRMALIHDLAETVTGDLTPYDGLTNEEKCEREEMGLNQLLEDIPNRGTYIDLWFEYEKQESREARILKNIDKLEMALQASEYQGAFPDRDLSEFLSTCDRQINIPEIRSLFEEVKGK